MTNALSLPAKTYIRKYWQVSYENTIPRTAMKVTQQWNSQRLVSLTFNNFIRVANLFSKASVSVLAQYPRWGYRQYLFIWSLGFRLSYVNDTYVSHFFRP